MRRYVLFLLFFAFFVTGCASITAQRVSASFDRPKDCQEFFERVDEKVKETKVRDASSAPVLGFPYLRTNRFLSALKNNLKNDQAKNQWVQWMQKLDLESRKKEIANLPEEKVLSLGFQEKETLMARISSCSSELLEVDLRQPEFHTILHPLVKVPDEYSVLMRTLGLYPLISLPVAMVTDESRKKMRARFEPPLDKFPIEGEIKTFVPLRTTVVHEREIEKIMMESSRDPLGIPLPDKDQERRLVEALAPVLIQDVAASYDRIGEVAWRKGRIEVNPQKPMVYYYFSHAFFKEEPILQINYVFWYSERAGENPPSIEKGHLDGLTIRLSLDPQGKPFMVDVQNNCGCYHLFSPDRQQVERIKSRPWMFDSFVAQWLPDVSGDVHLGLRMNSGWHQVQRVLAIKEISDPIRYELAPYDLLETLPHEEGRRESLFDERGIAKGSERIERFILFSMGIPSIGSMRQRGHHAIELIGQVHFDDPSLLDKNFSFK